MPKTKLFCSPILISLFLISSCQKTPHFSTSNKEIFQSFQPIDVSLSTSNKTEIISLQDNKTLIYELPNGQIYIKRVDPESNKEYMINLDRIQSDMKFSEKAKTKEDVQIEQQSFPVLEWTPLIGKNTYPHKRRGHSAIVLDNYIIFFGGCYLDLQCFNDVYFFNMDTYEWTNPKISGTTPCEREGHAAVLYGSKMYVFGGSSTSGFLSDLYELDLINLVWTQLNFVGSSPKGIANHQGVVDNNGRIVIFGGYSDEGYSDEVYFIDIVNKRWIKPIISGKTPQAREHFSMNFLRNKIWIFGGYTTGGVLNDLHILDLETMYWIKADTNGNRPSQRQGHIGVKQGKELYIIGGCNYRLNVCYKETYLLNTETLYWTKLEDSQQTVFTERDGHSANAFGELIVLFGGCRLMDSCSNDIMALNTNIYCPLNCSNNGICRNQKCLCYQGFQENDCSIEIKCHLDCSNRGKCRSDGKCTCYPGYTGQDCELFIPCPSNCTAADHGVCRADSTCSCFEGFSGSSCESSASSISSSYDENNNANGTNETGAVGCQNNCSDRGICNAALGVCICESGYFGNNCEKSEKDLLNETNSNVVANETPKNGEKNPEQQKSESQTNAENKTNPENKTNNASTSIPKLESSNTTQNLAQKESKLSAAMIKQNTTSLNNTEKNGTQKGNSSELNISSNSEKNTSLNVSSKSENTSSGGEKKISSTQENQTNSSITSSQKSQDIIKSLNKTNIENSSNESNSSKTNNSEASKLTRVWKANLSKALTAQMFGLADEETALMMSSVNENPANYDVHNCENECSFNGLCLKNVCYCRQGFTGNDCAFSKMVDLQKGEKISNLLILSASSLFIGFVIGCILIWYLSRDTNQEDLKQLKGNDDEDELEDDESAN